MRIDTSKARKYLSLTHPCQDANTTPKTETLAEHRQHCEAKPGNCPFEKQLEKGDSIDTSNSSVTQTRKFKDWFGDWSIKSADSSKVVDTSGNPLVVYHGTPSSFDSFDTSKIGNWNYGFHFGTPKAANRRVNKTGKATLIPCYLNMRHPFRSPDGFGIPKALVFDTLAEEATKQKRPDIARALIACGDAAENLWEVGFENEDEVSKKATAVLRSALRELGYDGIVYKNEYEQDAFDDEDSYMVLDPNQIKSAVSNNGSFSASSNNIYR